MEIEMIMIINSTDNEIKEQEEEKENMKTIYILLK